MSRVQVSGNRSPFGLIAALIAGLLLISMIAAGRIDAPPEPTPVAELVPTPSATAESTPSTPSPTPNPQRADLPDAFLVTFQNESVVLLDPQTDEVLVDWGYATDFVVHNNLLAIVDAQTARVINLQSGAEQASFAFADPHAIIAPAAAPFFSDDGTTLSIMHFVQRNIIDVELQITQYVLIVDQINQASIPLDELVQVVDGLDFLYYTTDTLIMKGKDTLYQYADLLPEAVAIADVALQPQENSVYVLGDDLRLRGFRVAASDQTPELEVELDLLQVLPDTLVYAQAELVFADAQTLYVKIPARDTSAESLVLKYDLLTHNVESIGLETIREASLWPDTIGGGVWLADAGALRYWDGNSATHVLLTKSQRKALSVPSYSVDEAPVVFADEKSLQTPTLTPLQTLTQPESEPLVWVRTQTLDTDPAQMTIYTLAPDGSQQRIADHIVGRIFRPAGPPLFLQHHDNTWSLYHADPERSVPLALDALEIESFSEFNNNWYLWSPDYSLLAVVSQGADVRSDDTFDGYDQLVIIDVATGAVTVELDSQLAPDFTTTSLLGWSESRLYFVRSGNSIWQFDRTTGAFTEVFKPKYGFDTSLVTYGLNAIAFDAATQQIAYHDPGLHQIILYNIAQNSQRAIDSDGVFMLEFAPENGALAWIELAEPESRVYLLETAATEPQLIYQGNTLFPKTLNLTGQPQLWRDAQTLNFVENHELAVDNQFELRTQLTFDLATATLSGQLYPASVVVHHSSTATLALQLHNEAIYVLRIPHTSTAPDVVMSLGTFEETLFMPIYIP